MYYSTLFFYHFLYNSSLILIDFLFLVLLPSVSQPPFVLPDLHVQMGHAHLKFYQKGVKKF